MRSWPTTSWTRPRGSTIAFASLPVTPGMSPDHPSILATMSGKWHYGDSASPVYQRNDSSNLAARSIGTSRARASYPHMPRHRARRTIPPAPDRRRDCIPAGLPRRSITIAPKPSTARSARSARPPHRRHCRPRRQKYPTWRSRC